MRDEVDDGKRGELLAQCESLRRMAIIGVMASMVAAFLCILSVPCVYSYLQHVQSLLQHEADYCKVRSNTLWQQVAKTQQVRGVYAEENGPRVPRQSGYGSVPLALRNDYEGPTPPKESSSGSASGGTSGSSSPTSTTAGAAETPSCGCSFGPPGPAGEDGHDGKDGEDGLPGPDGPPGDDVPEGAQPTEADFCFECPPGQMGPRGPPGPKGEPGAPGTASLEPTQMEVFEARQDHLVLLDHPDNPGFLDAKVQLDDRESSKRKRDHQESRDHRALQDLLDRRALQGLQEHQGHLDRKDHPETKEYPDRKERSERQDNREFR
ncbi:CRE-RAM-2 protein [Aphelenchoides avenae]|nr:CRE-RAM-2 protein [Aphelenchus avenae]